MEKKFGVITYHRAINYGAVLQTYALQKKISELGFANEVIDYRCDVNEEKYLKLIKFKKCKNIKDMVKYFFFSKKYKEKHKKFRDFSSLYIKKTLPIIDKKDLLNLEESYSGFIAGSDQIWNHRITNLDGAYFLDFVKDINKKYTYAASFGISKIPNIKKAEYKNLIQGFNNISLREKRGIEIVKDLTGVDCNVVLDPSFLLTKESWSELYSDVCNEIDYKYILVYSLTSFKGYKYIKKFAKDLSNKTGFKIIWINTAEIIKDRKITYIDSAGPNDFVWLFQNAEYVVTNSFHGVSFSINLNKQFFVEFLQRDDTRLENILQKFNLNDRKISGYDAKGYIEKIDYSRVNVTLNNERKDSVKYLENFILYK